MPDTIYPPQFPFVPRFVDVEGQRLAYFDEGVGERTVLMVHGNPVSGYVFVPLMKRLLPAYRCIVPDLLGFGLSDKPDDPAAYSLSRHIARMEAFVGQLDLQDVILIGHDWGGPIGFGAALRQFERYRQLVVLNTMTEAPMRILPHYWLPFHFFLRAGRLFRYLVRQRNLFQKMGVGIMAAEDQAVYFRANASPPERAGIAAFPREIPYNDTHPNTPLLADIVAGLTSWDIPALVLFSDRDSVFTPEQGRRLAASMQQARFELISGPKHFLQYEAPDRLAQAILTFTNGITPARAAQ